MEHAQSPRTALQNYMNHVAQTDTARLAKDDERQLFAQLRNGGPEATIARHKLIETHTRLVIYIARHYQGAGMDLEDLIGFGNLGLIKAIDKINDPGGRGFDPAKGTWLTYVMTTIDRTIERAIAETTRTVRVPVNVHDALWKMERTRAALETKLGRSPDLDELAGSMGITFERLEVLRRAAGPTHSLESPLSTAEGDDRCFLDLIPDLRANPETALIEAEDEAEEMELVNSLLDSLSPREKNVITLRYGIPSGEEMTFEEIGKEIGVTRERARQIVVSALSKMRKQVETKSQYRLLN